MVNCNPIADPGPKALSNALTEPETLAVVLAEPIGEIFANGPCK